MKISITSALSMIFFNICLCAVYQCDVGTDADCQAE